MLVLREMVEHILHGCTACLFLLTIIDIAHASIQCVLGSHVRNPCIFST